MNKQKRVFLSFGSSFVMVILLFTLLWSVNFVSRAAPTATWYVDASMGNNSNDCQTSGSACRTIQATIDKASATDTIYIASGTYTESLPFNIDKNLILIGSGITSTIIDGGENSQILIMSDTAVIANISNLTMQNGRYTVGSGGAIQNGGTLSLSQVNVISSTATNGFGGGIYNWGTLTITDGLIDSNQSTSSVGGGIFNGGGQIWLENTTIARNSSSTNGAGIHMQSSGAQVTLLNSTVSGNNGTGIVATANTTLTIRSSAIISNSNYGISSYGTMRINDSIVSDNSPQNCATLLTSTGYNLEDGDSCDFNASGDLKNTNPLLGPLVDNGGATPTHALLVGSPAIDAGDVANCPATDQRNNVRPRDGNGNGTAVCDIGPFEYFMAWNYLPMVLKSP